VGGGSGGGGVPAAAPHSHAANPQGRSRIPTFGAAASSLRSSGWDVHAEAGQGVAPGSGELGGPAGGEGAGTATVALSVTLRGGGRRNCEFSDLRSPPVALAAAEYVLALTNSATGGRSVDGFWVPLVRDFAPRLGLFGLASLAYETLGTVPHVVLHVMGIGAAEHAGSRECRSAGGGATDLCVAWPDIAFHPSHPVLPDSSHLEWPNPRLDLSPFPMLIKTPHDQSRPIWTSLN
jgi:hypothetical protein